MMGALLVGHNLNNNLNNSVAFFNIKLSTFYFNVSNILDAHYFIIKNGYKIISLFYAFFWRFKNAVLSTCC